MNPRREPRGGRSSLFDGIEEGGIRAASSYSHEINEHENERALEGLQDRVILLKRLSGDINEEVDTHNRMLDRMGNDMDSSRGILSGTMDRFKTVFETKSSRRMLTLVAAFVGGVEMRWVDTYFPFTEPSFELEIYFKEDWLEVLGCGVTEQRILKQSGLENNVAWAFGLGLERLAMVLFDIPDIRLFWSDDERFTSQFKKGELGVKFKPFSKYPPCYKDISFWISESFTENNFCEVVRGIAGDLVEEVKLIDSFTNKKGMTSHCYRIVFRSMERSLTDEEVNDLQSKVRDEVQSKLNVELR